MKCFSCLKIVFGLKILNTFSTIEMALCVLIAVKPLLLTLADVVSSSESELAFEPSIMELESRTGLLKLNVSSCVAGTSYPILGIEQNN